MQEGVTYRFEEESVSMDIKERVVSNDQLQILCAPYADDLIELIHHGGNLDLFLQAKDQKYKSDYLKKTKILSQQTQQNFQYIMKGMENKLKELNQAKQCSDWLRSNIYNLFVLYPQDKHAKLRDFLKNMADGQTDPQALTSFASGLLKNVLNWPALKKANAKLNSFVENYNAQRIHETFKKSDNENVRALYNDLMSSNLRSEYLKKVELDILTLENQVQDLKNKINQSGEDSQSDDQYEQEDRSRREQENELIRAFVQTFRTKQNLQTNEWVGNLGNAKDDDFVFFNFLIENIEEKKVLFFKIANLLHIQTGIDFDQWFIRKIDNSDACEIWSPLIHAQQARDVIPEFVQFLNKSGIYAEKLMAVKTSDIFKNSANFLNKDPGWIYKNIKLMILKGKLDRKNPLDWADLKLEEKHNIVSILGGDYKWEEAPAGFGAYKQTKNAVLKEFDPEKYIFSGSDVSDNYCVLSAREGQSGSTFASADLNYACANIDHVAINSVAAKAGNINGTPVKIDFINVYNRSSDDVVAGNAPVLIDPDINLLAAKFVHVKYGQEEYFIKVDRRPNEFIQYLLLNSKAQPAQMFQSRPDVLERFKTQQKLLREGKIKKPRKTMTVDAQV